ncbi:general stress protein [Bacillus sp. 1P06AnD]|uniref:general stress protein n=1 Tax=Bacillus sp. 1P06AnD TaxID=3132208 RepID=UPI0039A2683D
MDKFVYGVYNDNYEVLRAIETLKYQGCDGSQITVLARDGELVSLTEEKEPDVKMVTTTTEESFLDKIMSFFSSDGMGQIDRQLSACHLTQEETHSYKRDLELGKILLLLNRKTPFHNKLQPDGDDSPTLQTMERYNAGLGLRDYPEPEPYEIGRHATTESTFEQEEEDAIDPHIQATAPEEEKRKKDMNDSEYDPDNDETPDPYLKNNTNVTNL